MKRPRRFVFDAVLSSVAAALVALVAVYLDRTAPLPPSVTPPVDPILDCRIDVFDLRDGTIDDAVTKLRAKGISISSVYEPDKDSPKPLNVHLDHPTVRQCLLAIEFQHPDTFGHYVTNNHVVICRDRWEDPAVHTRIYDVRDLVGEAAKFNRRFTPDRSSLFNRPGSDIDEQGQRLSQVLQKFCGEGWGYGYTGGSAFGSTYAVCGEEYGRLIVTQTPRSHDAIRIVLASLRLTEIEMRTRAAHSGKTP